MCLLLREDDDELRDSRILDPVRDGIDGLLTALDLGLPLRKEHCRHRFPVFTRLIEQLPRHRVEERLEDLADDLGSVNGTLCLTLAGVVGARVRAMDHHLTLTLRHACLGVRHTLLTVFGCHVFATSLLAALHFRPKLHSRAVS